MLAAAGALLVLDSCSSTSKIKGLPDKLPEIALSGSNATPPHNLPNYEYPFDASGNYVSTWAAEGESRAGRPASATNDDEREWSNSHRGKVTASSKKKSGGKKGGSKSSSKASKKKSSADDDDDKPKAKSKPGTKSSKKSSAPAAKKSGTTAAKKKASSSDDDDKPKPKPKAKSTSSKTKKKADS